jgi:toxin ParE1/3/4
MPKIRKHARAESDLIEIWLHTYERWGETQAERYFDELEKGIRQLGLNLELGPRCDHIREGYRSLRINRHVVYYTRTPSVIHIIRVLHERMDPGGHFADL